MSKIENKSICKIAKKSKFLENLDEFYKLINKPKFVCSKCGSVANDRKNLCKPVEFTIIKKLNS